MTDSPYDGLPQPHVFIQSPTQMSQRSLLTIFLIVGLLMSVGLGVLLYTVWHLTTIQEKADQVRDSQALAVKTAGFKNRSVTCATLASSVGRQGLPPTCLEKPVLAYYDPDAPNRAVSASTAATNILGLKNRAATCEGLFALGVRYKLENNCLSDPVLKYWNPYKLTAFKP